MASNSTKRIARQKKHSLKVMNNADALLDSGDAGQSEFCCYSHTALISYNLVNLPDQ